MPREYDGRRVNRPEPQNPRLALICFRILVHQPAQPQVTRFSFPLLSVRIIGSEIGAREPRPRDPTDRHLPAHQQGPWWWCELDVWIRGVPVHYVNVVVV